VSNGARTSLICHFRGFLKPRFLRRYAADISVSINRSPRIKRPSTNRIRARSARDCSAASASSSEVARCSRYRAIRYLTRYIQPPRRLARMNNARSPRRKFLFTVAARAATGDVSSDDSVRAERSEIKNDGPSDSPDRLRSARGSGHRGLGVNKPRYAFNYERSTDGARPRALSAVPRSAFTGEESPE